MRRNVITLLIVLAAMAAGAGIGTLVTQRQAKLLESQVDTLETQLQEARTLAEETTKSASAEKARLSAELNRSRNELNRLNTELTRTKTMVTQLKKALEQFSPQSPQAVSEPDRLPQPQSVPTAGAATAPPAGDREYVVKEGDSFWKIAANELGSGIRYKEIQQLNPQVPPDKPLTIGLKLKLPAR